MSIRHPLEAQDVSQYFVWVHIPVHVVEYDWQLPTVDCICLE